MDGMKSGASTFGTNVVVVLSDETPVSPAFAEPRGWGAAGLIPSSSGMSGLHETISRQSWLISCSIFCSLGLLCRVLGLLFSFLRETLPDLAFLGAIKLLTS